MSRNSSEEVPGGHAQGHRLLQHIVDDTARETPLRPFAYIPISASPQEGWKPMTYQEAANGINFVAHKLVKASGHPPPKTFPTVAYIGPNDLRYILFLLGAVKAGYKSLLISPRNTDEVQLHLFAETACELIWHAESYKKLVDAWLQKRHMESTIMPELATVLATAVSHFPYAKTFQEAEWDPMVVLHTSGSTGIPKPIVSRQGLWSIGDEFRLWPEFQGTRVCYSVWAQRATKIYLAFPFFHAGGLNLFTNMTLLMGTACVLPVPERPLSGHLVQESLLSSGAEAAALPSSILEELSLSEQGIEALQGLGWICFGGGNLSSHSGARLADRGVMLCNGMGSTEFGLYPVYFVPDPKLWQYFLFNSHHMGCEFRPFEGTEENVFELFAVRRRGSDQPMAGVFYTFPDLDEWSTRDLYKPHPTLPHYWSHYGRVDNVIVFSNGEKLNPVTIEDVVSAHSLVKGAIVVGQGRFQAALVLEAGSRDTSDRPEKPFLRASKGTIQRSLTAKLYEDEIDCLYRKSEEAPLAGFVKLDVSSRYALVDSLRLLFHALGTPLLEPDTDFFGTGLDSLQVMNVTRQLRAGLAAIGMPADNITTGTIYKFPTLRQLAVHLGSTDGCGSSTLGELELMQQLLAQHTKDLPCKVSGKPDPLFAGQTVLLTGSTGSLGSYLLDALISSPNVTSVFALNRHPDGGRARQTSVSEQRGISTSWDKVYFLAADLSEPTLGLSPTQYAAVCAQVDRIIHNAWPVNFHFPAATFAPHIAGVRHLVDLAASACKNVPLVFVSSRGAVDGWVSETGDPVPERQLPDLRLAALGYGQAKAVSSLLLDAACEVSGLACASIRLGQIAGPRSAAGAWNEAEFLPSLVRSSVYLGLVPDSLGTVNLVDWVCIEDMAGLILDIAGVTEPVSVQDVVGYFHGVSPEVTDWTALVSIVQEVYAGRVLKVVSFKEWVEALERSAEVTPTEDMEENPGVKLLDLYRGFLRASDSGRMPVVLATERTKERSPTMRRLKAVTPNMMKQWCQQWGI